MEIMILPLIGQMRHIEMLSSAPAVLYRWLMHMLSAMILVMILAIAVLFWPIPYAGFDVDPLTATVTFVEPGSAAAQAGLQLGESCPPARQPPMGCGAYPA